MRFRANLLNYTLLAVLSANVAAHIWLNSVVKAMDTKVERKAIQLKRLHSTLDRLSHLRQSDSLGGKQSALPKPIAKSKAVLSYALQAKMPALGKHRDKHSPVVDTLAIKGANSAPDDTHHSYSGLNEKEDCLTPWRCFRNVRVTIELGQNRVRGASFTFYRHNKAKYETREISFNATGNSSFDGSLVKVVFVQVPGKTNEGDFDPLKNPNAPKAIFIGRLENGVIRGSMRWLELSDDDVMRIEASSNLQLALKDN